MYVLKSEGYGVNKSHWDGYYTGDRYIYQGEVYAICDTDISKAKKYSSLKRAENAAESLFNKVCNYSFKPQKIGGDNDAE